jgi:hypothetical protein
VKITALVIFRLAAFLGIAGLVYVATAREPAGGSLLLVAAASFTYVGLILRAAVREAEHASGEAEGPEKEPAAEDAHVGPTIWPFAFSLAAIGFVLGLVVTRWLLLAGAGMFVASTVGWFVDIRHQHDNGHGAG